MGLEDIEGPSTGKKNLKGIIAKINFIFNYSSPKIMNGRPLSHKFYTQCFNLSHSNLYRTYVVFNIMSLAGKALVKVSFGSLQSYFLAENIPTMPNFEWSNVLETEK